MIEPPDDEPLLEATDLRKTYPDGLVRALDGVSLGVDPGEWVAILGPSGCGKSTLLHLLGGLDRPDSGEIRFAGRSLSEFDPDEYRARHVGFVFQSFHLVPTLSALENVQVPMFETKLPRKQRAERADALLAEVGLTPRRHARPSRMSVGERQRTAIARALANEPTLLLADEPTGNLDSRMEAEVLQVLDRVRTDRGLTLVMVTHSAEVAESADRSIRLRDGRLAE